eukprot:scaffold9607_cov113-Isochrysis_galbana.AAC.4
MEAELVDQKERARCSRKSQHRYDRFCRGRPLLQLGRHGAAVRVHGSGVEPGGREGGDVALLT